MWRFHPGIYVRICLKSLLPECGHPRPQHCSISCYSLFLQGVWHYHVAAPDDGRTPTESLSAPKQRRKENLVILRPLRFFTGSFSVWFFKTYHHRLGRFIAIGGEKILETRKQRWCEVTWLRRYCPRVQQCWWPIATCQQAN